MSEEHRIPHTPYAAYNPDVAIYNLSAGHARPLEHTGWKDEVLSWKTGCYLHAGLNPTDTYRVAGPDATAMFNDICVNNIERLKVGSSTHAIMCSPRGNITAHGMLLRVAEQEYMTYWLEPVASCYATSGEYDVVGEDLTGTKFLLQIGGPRALEVVEAALGEDFHDVRFLRHRPATIGSANVGVTGGELSILRVGMAGSLAYEVHGEIADAPRVYEAIYEAGKPFGLRRLGTLSYFPLNHTENGFPQSTAHFQLAWAEDPKLTRYLRAKGWTIVDEPGRHSIGGFNVGGSIEGDLSVRYCNPIELGWGHLVKLDHDFVGRDALAPLKESPTHRMVTLVWEPEDIIDVYRSQFEHGEEYELIEFPADPRNTRPGLVAYNHSVVKDGRQVGMSMGRMYSYFYRKMISICPIEVEHSEIGTEVTVIWGAPGSRQKEIRAVVDRYPMLDTDRNESIDVDDIPRLGQTASPGGGG